LFGLSAQRPKEASMALFYEDLIEPTIVKQVSEEVAYCRCTRSKNLPFCDGSHEGTNIQPHILKFDQPTTIAICRCWRSKDHPYCDGTHGRLVKPKERPRRGAE
jgi:CDGSH-type Zn-finger protein